MRDRHLEVSGIRSLVRFDASRASSPLRRSHDGVLRQNLSSKEVVQFRVSLAIV